MTEYFEGIAGLRMCRCKSSRCSHKLPCTANFGQQPYKRGPDISLLESHLQQQWDAAANGSLGEIVIYPMSCLKVQWSARIALMDIHMCGKQELMAGPMAKAAHTVLDRLCVSIIPLQQNSRKLRKQAAESDFDANKLMPHSYTSASNVKVAWKCRTCSHAWRAS